MSPVRSRRPHEPAAGTGRGRGRHPACALAFLGLLTTMLAACGPAPSLSSDPLQGGRGLEAWVSVTQDSTGAIQPGVTVSLPYRSLIFREDPRRGGLVSGLDLQVVALRGDQQVGGGVAAREVRVADHPDAGARTELVLTAPLRIRGTAPVDLEVRARVQATRRVWTRRLGFAPASLAAMPVWITAVETGLPPADSGGRLLTSATAGLDLAVTLQRQLDGPPWPEAGIELISEVAAPALDRPRRRRTTVAPLGAADTTRVVHAWPLSRLPFGRSRVTVALETRRDDEVLRLPREPALELVNLAIPFADDRAWRRHLGWLDGRLPAAVRDSLAALPASDRPGAWAGIWTAIGEVDDVAPEAAERRHLQRIVTADDRYSSFGRGALSDRGRVYIRWGEPARVETFADPHTAGAMWQIWVYPERGRRVLFFDAHGFGDFRLRREEPLLP